MIIMEGKISGCLQQFNIEMGAMELVKKTVEASNRQIEDYKDKI